ncbi:MAG: fumarylacetoacetate hydrolase family protein [Bacillota bacterium]
MDNLVRELASRLQVAWITGQVLPPLTVTHPELTVDHAYAIQRELVRLLAGDQCRVIGRKVGLTSLAMQRMLNVYEPDFGSLLDSMVVPCGGHLSAGELIQPRVEAEIAFVLARDLRGPGVGTRDVLLATAGVMASLEIIDSRIADWKIKLVDTVADNGSSARVVLGDALFSPTGRDLRLVGMILEVDGQVQQTASGAAALGHPAAAVAWLANKLAEFGEHLKAGDVILSGALGSALPAKPGSTYRATFDGWGSVEVSFVP